MTTVPNTEEYRDLEDQELVALLKTGDKIAFTAIYERYVRVLYTLVIRYVKNREDTLDILQVTIYYSGISYGCKVFMDNCKQQIIFLQPTKVGLFEFISQL